MAVRGEFEDSALLMVFGQTGAGVFAMPSAIEKEVQKQYGVRLIGRVDSVRERFYAITIERKLKHPGVVAISDAARLRIFKSTPAAHTTIPSALPDAGKRHGFE